MAAPKQTDPQFKLRLTRELKDAVEKAASANNRSMNAEIIHRLNLSFEIEPDFTMESARTLAFSKNRDEEKVPAPGDVVTIEIQKAVRNAVEKTIDKLENEGFITFLLDINDVDNPAVYHKLAKRRSVLLKKDSSE